MIKNNKVIFAVTVSSLSLLLVVSTSFVRKLTVIFTQCLTVVPYFFMVLVRNLTLIFDILQLFFHLPIY